MQLPASGIDVEPAGEGAYRVRPAGAAGDPPSADLTAQFTAMVTRAISEGSAHASTLIATLQTLVRGIFRGVFVFSMMMMISAYLLITSENIFGFFRSLVRANRQAEFDDLVRRIDRGLAGVVRGQLIICLVNGVLSGIGFYIAGLAYWPVLALIVLCGPDASEASLVVGHHDGARSSDPEVLLDAKDARDRGANKFHYSVSLSSDSAKAA